MFRLITPAGMLFTTALLAIYGTYAFMIGMIERSLPLQLGGVVSIAAVYGAAMVTPWARPLVYLLTAGFFAKLSLSIYEAHRAEFFGSHFGSLREVAWSLLPSAVMALLGVLCCVIVHRQFRTPTSSPLQPDT